MKRIFTLLKGSTLLLALGFTTNTWSQPIARWTFEGVTFAATAGQTPSLTAGTTTADEGTQTGGSAFTAFHNAAATVYSTPSGNGSTKSMSSNTWSVGDYYQFQVNTTGFNGIAITFDAIGSNTGPKDFKVQYSVDGVTYLDGPTYVVPNNAGAAYTWSATTPNNNTNLSFDMSAYPSLNNKSAVYFRLVDVSTTAINGATVGTGGTSRVDNFAVWQASILPLNLTSFTASLRAGVATLNWTSQNEEKVKGFAIERSLDGRSFSEVNFVNAVNRAGVNNYSYADNTVKPGVNYYRLKMLDLDGSTRYSSVVMVSNKTFLKAELFPNPVISSLTVSHDQAVNGSIIRILSLEGRQIKTMAVQPGSMQTSLNVSDLVKGNYLLVFESNGEKTTAKFTKQ